MPRRAPAALRARDAHLPERLRGLESQRQPAARIAWLACPLHLPQVQGWPDRHTLLRHAEQNLAGPRYLQGAQALHIRSSRTNGSSFATRIRCWEVRTAARVDGGRRDRRAPSGEASARCPARRVELKPPLARLVRRETFRLIPSRYPSGRNLRRRRFGEGDLRPRGMDQ
jgi:hypothetical protein